MRSKILLILGLIVLSNTTKITGQTDVNNAQAIFVYNFLSHIKWPDATVGDSYVIGFIGKTSTFNYLKQYTANRKVGNKGIKVVQYNTAAEAANCQVLFVAHNKSSLMGDIKAQLAGKSCLIVGEKEGTVANGAAVDFRITNGKLRYKIDETNAKQHNLFVSRALLTMSL